MIFAKTAGSLAASARLTLRSSAPMKVVSRWTSMSLERRGAPVSCTGIRSMVSVMVDLLSVLVLVIVGGEAAA